MQRLAQTLRAAQAAPQSGAQSQRVAWANPEPGAQAWASPRSTLPERKSSLCKPTTAAAGTGSAKISVNGSPPGHPHESSLSIVGTAS